MTRAPLLFLAAALAACGDAPAHLRLPVDRDAAVPLPPTPPGHAGDPASPVATEPGEVAIDGAPDGGSPDGASPSPTDTPDGGEGDGGSNVREVLRGLDARGALPTLDHTASLLGSDADADGVRDDVTAHLSARGGAAERALRQLARALAGTLVVDLEDEAALHGTSQAIAEAASCVISVLGPLDGPRGAAEVRAITFNTPGRFSAYAAYNAARSGAVITMPYGETCR